MNKTTFRSIRFLFILVLIISGYYTVYASSATVSLNLDYYISPQGSDSNACTLAAPCQTFEKAMNLSQPGDTIHLLQGIYDQKLLISNNGVNVVGEGAIINGANTGEDLCVQITGDNIVLDDITVENCQSHGIIVLGDNVTVQNSTVTNSVLENYPTGSMSGGWGSAFKSAQGASNVKFLNNQAYRNFGEGFVITKTMGAVLRGNVAYDNYSINFYPDNSSNVVLTENLSACSGNPSFNRDGHRPHGIALGEEVYSDWTTHPRNILVTQNVISGCDRGFLYWGTKVSDGGMRDVTVQNNTFYGNERDLSLAYEAGTENVVFSHNIFSSNLAPWVESLSGITFQENFWVGSLPTDNALGTNDVAGDPDFMVEPVWNNAESFRLNNASSACGYGRWECKTDSQTPSSPTPTSPKTT